MKIKLNNIRNDKIRHSRSNIIASYLYFVSALLYVLGQTSILAEQKDLTSGISLITLLAGVTLIIKSSKYARNFLARPTFVTTTSTIIVINILTIDPAELLTLIKLIILLLAATTFCSEKGTRSIEKSADGTITAVAIVVISAKLGIIPTETFSAFNLWTKNSGGFTNPNNGPYFLYVASLLYFLTGKYKKQIVVTIITVMFYIIDIYSRTYLAIIILFTLLALWQKYVTISLRPTLMVVKGGALAIFIIGIYFYLGSVFYPNSLEIYKGTAFDAITSFRISVALEEAVYQSDSIIGISFKRLDSLYTELLYFCGPVLVIIFWNQFLKPTKITNNYSYNLRLNFSISAILIAGLFESQLLNLTPLASMLFYYSIESKNGIKKHNASLENHNDNLLHHQRHPQPDRHC